jgi:hypothetical protein
MAFKVAGILLATAVLAFLVLSIGAWSLGHGHLGDVGDLSAREHRQLQWMGAGFLFAAFLSWCGARYCFNRAESREPTKLDRFLFGLAQWLLIGTAVLLLACWLFLPAIIP